MASHSAKYLTYTVGGTTYPVQVESAIRDGDGNEIKSTYQKISQKNQANGYAGLDANGKVLLSQIPDTVAGGLMFGGTIAANGTISLTVAFVDAYSSYLTTEQIANKTMTITENSPNNWSGVFFIASDTVSLAHYTGTGIEGATYPAITLEVGDWLLSRGQVGYDRIDNTDAVVSVNGHTGIVSLTKSDVGLGNVDNTSDANKPISTATQTALDNKLNIDLSNIAGGVLSIAHGGTGASSASSARSNLGLGDAATYAVTTSVSSGSSSLVTSGGVYSSLLSYLPLSAGSGKALTGDLYFGTQYARWNVSASEYGLIRASDSGLMIHDEYTDGTFGYYYELLMDAGSKTAVFKFSDESVSTTYTITFPKKTGTFALTSDITDALSSYLTTAQAALTYLTQSSASSTYLTQTNAANTYLSKSGGTLSGQLNFGTYKANFVSGIYSAFVDYAGVTVANSTAGNSVSFDSQSIKVTTTDGTITCILPTAGEAPSGGKFALANNTSQSGYALKTYVDTQLALKQDALSYVLGSSDVSLTY